MLQEPTGFRACFHHGDHGVARRREGRGGAQRFRASFSGRLQELAGVPRLASNQPETLVRSAKVKRGAQGFALHRLSSVRFPSRAKPCAPRRTFVAVDIPRDRPGETHVSYRGSPSEPAFPVRPRRIFCSTPARRRFSSVTAVPPRAAEGRPCAVFTAITWLSFSFSFCFSVRPASAVRAPGPEASARIGGPATGDAAFRRVEQMRSSRRAPVNVRRRQRSVPCLDREPRGDPDDRAELPANGHQLRGDERRDCGGRTGPGLRLHHQRIGNDRLERGNLKRPTQVPLIGTVAVNGNLTGTSWSRSRRCLHDVGLRERAVPGRDARQSPRSPRRRRKRDVLGDDHAGHTTIRCGGNWVSNAAFAPAAASWSSTARASRRSRAPARSAA